MKKFLALLLAAMMLLPAIAMAETTDAVSSASVADYYGQYGLTGDDLMNAINSFSGFYLISTTNPDGTPNSAFFIFSMVKHEDKYYLQLGLAENQSKANLVANGKGMAVYAANPTGAEGAMPYAVAGARIWFDTIDDQAVIDALSANARQGAMFYEIVEIKPLG
ncbi:MAG: hypothetical protein IJZ74_02705 [Clostridia bacterium]|nr:hypothetical protein [Clostridia bacterium]